MANLLVEFFSEEIPARMQAQAVMDLKHLWKEALKKEGLTYTSKEAYVTPRRLTVHIEGLPLIKEARQEEIKGPRVGASPQALEGFLRSTNSSIENCIQKKTDKGLFYFAQITYEERKTSQILAEIIYEILKNFPWPKSMRWGSNSFYWVRPLHHILAVFDNQVIDGKFELGADRLIFTNETKGHRFLAPENFKVTDFDSYQDQLKQAFVILDQDERQQIIKGHLHLLAKEKNITLKEDNALLAEVSGAAEWPEVFLGSIDPSFLDVPYEVLETSMRVHQKYFSFRDKNGKFAPFFATVANNIPKDGGTKIIAGNEQILKSRLFDAQFFWTQDRKKSLEERVSLLENITFHAQLGSLLKRVKRLEILTEHIAKFINADSQKAKRAAYLSKADLVTGMVGEFPELQGTMGRYYALHDGENDDIANAIAEHYAPLGPKDFCPKEPVSMALAIADKIDALIGFFGKDLKPTGSKDPFALRRSALGIIRIILENKLRIPLHLLIQKSYEAYGDVLRSKPIYLLQEEIMEFFVDRLKVFLRDQGIRHDYISAIFALRGEDDLLRLCLRVRALSEFLQTEAGEHLLTAYRRAANILRIEEKKEGISFKKEVQPDLLQENEEKDLFSVLNSVILRAKEKIELEEYDEAMKYLVMLKKPVDLFFDKITVNTEKAELRENRLKLLSHIVTTLHEVADFQKIEG